MRTRPRRANDCAVLFSPSPPSPKRRVPCAFLCKSFALDECFCEFHKISFSEKVLHPIPGECHGAQPRGALRVLEFLGWFHPR